MKYTKNLILKENSQLLRKSMTKEERHLWYDFLKNLNITVKRQKIIGPYIVDFYCAYGKTIIELDGSQHFEENEIIYDAKRDKYLKEHGYTILRYSNYEINKNFNSVCQDILDKLSSK